MRFLPIVPQLGWWVINFQNTVMINDTDATIGFEAPFINWRTERLIAFKYMWNMSEYSTDDINLISDHKGELTVEWASTPSEQQINYARAVWATLGENEIVHIINGKNG